jgi:hypothetical protein
MRKFGYVFSTDHLQTEKAVINAIEQLLALSEIHKDVLSNMKIQPEIYHVSTAYTQDNM